MMGIPVPFGMIFAWGEFLHNLFLSFILSKTKTTCYSSEWFGHNRAQHSLSFASLKPGLSTLDSFSFRLREVNSY
jgi:hypothetical protein